MFDQISFDQFEVVIVRRECPAIVGAAAVVVAVAVKHQYSSRMEENCLQT